MYKKTTYWLLNNILSINTFIFVVYKPTFSIFENKKSDLIYYSLAEEKDKIENGIHVWTGSVIT